jgi:hypothetical protein
MNSNTSEHVEEEDRGRSYSVVIIAIIMNNGRNDVL